MEIRNCCVLNLRNSIPECDVVWFGTNLPTFSRNAPPHESEAGKSITFLGNVDILLPDCTASRPSRRWCVHLPVHLLSFRLFQVHARIASYLHAHATTQRDSRRARKELERNRRTTLLLTGIAVLFAVSWLPLGQ